MFKTNIKDKANFALFADKKNKKIGDFSVKIRKCQVRANWVISHDFVACFFFFFFFIFKNKLYQKILQEYPQSVIRPVDVLSGLIWVQTVEKIYQQTTLVGKELNATFQLHVQNLVPNHILYQIIFCKLCNIVYAISKS